MFSYPIQYPNINASAKYLPRNLRPGKLTHVDVIEVDLTPLNDYVPQAFADTSIMDALWVSAVLNLSASIVTPTLPAKDFLGGTESKLVTSCLVNNTDITSIYAVLSSLNQICLCGGVQFDLYRVGEWDQIQLIMMEGYTVMVGGTIYSSFSSAESTGVVPMPKVGEDLLGGHIMNLVAFNRTQETGTAIGNLGTTFGNRGKITVRGSYLRNLSICRDFFVLVPRSVSYAS